MPARAVKRLKHALTQDEWSVVDAISSEDFERPTHDSIRDVQQRYAQDGVADLEEDPATGVKMVKGKIWVPASDVDLTTRLLVLGHCGPQGHRSAKALARE